ncbi:MAG: hypothetical protein JWM47_3817 [Acidimicrobiales bacterium]|nr:hypothetical protein [Acidimicrobiales bacterium]
MHGVHRAGPAGTVKHPDLPDRGPGELVLSEVDTSAVPIALEADPTAVRVTLSSGTARMGVTLDVDPERPHLAVLGDLDHLADESLLAPLAYLALQRARVWRCSVLITTEPVLADLLGMSPLPQGDRWAAPLDRSSHYLYAACEPKAREHITGRFVDEALATLARRARGFADNAWCRAVRDGRLGREQYVAALANTHQYVRYTPRLLARAIALAEEEELRNHFTRHFRGEQNHDRLVEADLRYLGADVEYVTGAMVPSTGTQAFMVVQESGIGFYGDYVRFLAAPFVAEGLSASLEPEFLDSLEDCIRSWGYDDPTRATRFLRSHVEFDGGGDGHFAQVAAVLARILSDDTVQQRFLNTLHLAADAFHRSYDGYAEESRYA